MHEKQKKHALFVRLPIELVKKIDEYKESRKLPSRNAAILELVKKGLNNSN
ncbi:ribbon-helix-helix protein, CopG family [Bacillus sp. SA1-12]|uniref:ribbon-helix-helix protein, CopG family n=1 Tax=Bacillus sp. SA1-12 TaxID=1455638 RepID=UPI000A61056C|nr:ribbon-helix-helix protein, CopG family [Bacillus sp. SA1-12]